MKANRKFVEADDAVSPVIAVILMVAITVVLAATVFVLVSDIGANTQKNAPQIGWTTDEVDDQLSVSQAPNQVNWKDMHVKASVDAVKFALNGAALDAADADHTMENDAEYEEVDPAATPNPVITGGDYIEFCVDAATAATNVVITILHAPSNAVSKEFTLTTLDICA